MSQKTDNPFDMAALDWLVDIWKITTNEQELWRIFSKFKLKADEFFKTKVFENAIKIYQKLDEVVALNTVEFFTQSDKTEIKRKILDCDFQIQMADIEAKRVKQNFLLEESRKKNEQLALRIKEELEMRSKQFSPKRSANKEFIEKQIEEAIKKAKGKS